MNTKWVIGAVICLGFAFGVVVGQTTPGAKPVDYESVAQRIVTQCAGVKEGEIVSISGNVRDIELLEDLAVQVRKLGAFPLMGIGTDRLSRRMMVDVFEKYDGQSRRLDLELAKIVDVGLTVDWASDPALNSDIPRLRIENMNRASVPVSDIYTRRGVRGVNLGNGMYPSKYRAEEFGIPLVDLQQIFWGGVNIDYAKLQARCAAVSQILAQGKEVRITNPNGTDLKVQIGGRPVFVSDGVISPEDIKLGYAASQVYLPAGEVFVAPVPGTAEGKVVINRIRNYGKDIYDLTLVFKAGKLISISGKPGYEILKEEYDLAGPGKEDFGYIDIGVNPQVKSVPGSKMQTWVEAGMVNVGAGGNVWAGGDNNCPFGIGGYLPGSTVTVDGKPLVEGGKLKAPEM